MSAHVSRLRSLFTAEYAKRINAQLVHPMPSVVVKPNELESALARPLHMACYEPEKEAPYLAATLSYGIIKGHPFMDGNKRTAFFLAHEYSRAMGLPGLVDSGKSKSTDSGAAHKKSIRVAEYHMATAAGTLDLEGLSQAMKSK